MFDRIITDCSEAFGPAPRRLSIWDRLTYLRTPRPDWLYESPADELETLFLNIHKLKANGRVVWGHVIQANNLIFSPGKDDVPGEVVYSLDEPIAQDVDELAQVAGKIASLKHTKPDDPELASIADYLTSEWTRVYGKPVPASLAGRGRYHISTIYFFRKHLPTARLAMTLLPIIVSPTPPHVALVLPSRYWPRSLVELWRNA